jgi:hypothetical protein
MIADAAAGARVDMNQHAAAWLTEHARSQQPPEEAGDEA